MPNKTVKTASLLAILQLSLIGCSSDGSNVKPDPINDTTKKCPSGMTLVCRSRGPSARPGQDPDQHDICICEVTPF